MLAREGELKWEVVGVGVDGSLGEAAGSLVDGEVA